LPIDFVPVKVSFFHLQNHYTIPAKNYIIHTPGKRTTPTSEKGGKPVQEGRRRPCQLREKDRAKNQVKNRVRKEEKTGAKSQERLSAEKRRNPGLKTRNPMLTGGSKILAIRHGKPEAG
jgi:hypothetical protein